MASTSSPERSALLAQFASLAEAESASVQLLPSLDRVAVAVRDYLKMHRLPARLIVASNVPGLDWSGLEVSSGPISTDGDAVCTACYAGIAEAGALVMLSGSAHPTEFNFLAETHLVILHGHNIVPSFEHFWTKLEADGLAANMPRMMNFIVGPSRTADLGVPSKLGAHGPARLHILIIDEESD
jgi:L-lactate dehydrogenase complex protein LldG